MLRSKFDTRELPYRMVGVELRRMVATLRVIVRKSQPYRSLRMSLHIPSCRALYIGEEYNSRGKDLSSRARVGARARVEDQGKG